MVRIVGVDGCKAGWLAVEWHPSTQHSTAKIFQSFRSLVDHNVDCIAVDMPIGLCDFPNERRQADLEARRFLKLRASKEIASPGSRVFPSPSRQHLAVSNQTVAEANKSLPDGSRFTQQSYAIVRKISEVDQAVSPGDPVWEVHPEVSFAELCGYTLPKKKTAIGKQQRLEALNRLGFNLEKLNNDLGTKRARWAVDDLLDACVAAWSANRIFTGTAQSLPSPANQDSRGLRMAIFY
jgi:predicted RNase H-like nuclease